MNFSCKPFFNICALCFCICMFFSCSQKDYPHNTPFVYENKINLKGNIPKNEKENVLTNLPNYWADSLRARKIQQFGFFYKLTNPPVFDTTNITPSIAFMRGYLKSQGYYTTNLSADTSLSVKGDQQRVTVTMNVDPGKITIIDSLAYDFKIDRLQQIANNNSKASLIEPKKSAFSKQLIASELDRLVTAFRQKGFYQLTRDNIVAVADTTDIALMQLITDPAELAQKIAEAAERRKQNPTCIITIKLRENKGADSTKDSLQLIQYRMGNIYYYPEMQPNEIPDSMMVFVNRDTVNFKRITIKNTTMFYKQGLFKFNPLREHTYIHSGNFYNESNYFKTINNLNQMGPWRQIDTRDSIRKDTVDFHFFLYPAKKQNITPDIELSRNTGDFLGSANLFGIAFNTSYLNRNVFKRGVQLSTVFSNGVELTFDPNAKLLQTIQSSLGVNFSFPKILVPFKLRNTARLDVAKTQLDVNGSYTDRNEFFRLRSLVLGWGYQFKKKNNIFQVKFPNIELYSLDTLPLLDSAFKQNPFLRTSFNTGSVISFQFSLTKTSLGKNNPNVNNFSRLGLEVALPFPNSWRFLKVEYERRKLIQMRNNALAFRALAGVGINYGGGSKFGNTLPFFKQFVAGGPNSMRAWNLRQLGLGSSLLSDTSSTFRDRYGDIQFEVNAEYRYRIANIGGMIMGSALFVDVGNIWNLHSDPQNPLGTINFNRFANDLAIGAGTGLRLDFSYFLIRLDFGIKIKNPAQLENNGWNIKDFTWRNKEFTIIDPNTQNVIKRNNYAFQLGIGLPF